MTTNVPKIHSYLHSINDYSQQNCKHPQVINLECRYCHHIVVDFNYGIPFNYVHQGLRLSHEEAARYREIVTKNLIKQRKLHLILDIDHTLLHAVRFDSLDPKDFEFLKHNSKAFRESLFTFELNSSRVLVKLRPSVRTFLEEASSLFELSLYTKGTNMYARCIARLLDPQGTYFGNRIISRNDTPTQFKTLDIVVAQDRAVIIVDDTEIWPDNPENLIVIEKYCYFDTGSHGDVGYLKTRTDESEVDGELMKMLGRVKEAHRIFFEEDYGLEIDCRDIRFMM